LIKPRINQRNMIDVVDADIDDVRITQLAIADGEFEGECRAAKRNIGSGEAGNRSVSAGQCNQRRSADLCPRIAQCVAVRIAAA
jgi:hypothetical protein